MSKGEGVMYARSRVRPETVRTMLRGLKALIDNGCVINAITVVVARPGDLKERARRIGNDRRRPDQGTKQKPGKPGAKPTRRRRKGETDEQKVTRLARARQQRKRDRDRKQKKQKGK